MNLTFNHYGGDNFDFVDKNTGQSVGLNQIAESHIRLERQLAEAREEKKKIMRWMKKYLYQPNGYRSIGFSDLYEMYEQLKEKGE